MNYIGNPAANTCPPLPRLYRKVQQFPRQPGGPLFDGTLDASVRLRNSVRNPRRS